jgi:hypothetical protein
MACALLATPGDLNDLSASGPAPRREAFVPQAIDVDGHDLQAFIAMCAVTLLPKAVGRMEREKGLEGEQVFRSLVESHLGGVFDSLTAHGPDLIAKVGDRLLVFEVKTSEQFSPADKHSQSRQLASKLKSTNYGQQGTPDHTNRHVERLLARTTGIGDVEAAEQAVQILDAFGEDRVSHFGVAINPLDESVDVYPLDDEGRPSPLPSSLW